MPHENIYRRGEALDNVFVLCSGWAFRFIRLPDGRRQILSFLLPGDLFSAGIVFKDNAHFSVDALTEIRFSRFNRAEVKHLAVEDQDVLESLAKFCVAENTDADELITDLGQRSAEERIARLILNLATRLEQREVIREHRYPFPLRQRHIADYTGLTSVHVGRVMGAFRKDRVLELSGNVLTLTNRTKLERIAA
jgi:CRP-like cAMP-binding protein